jgi:hypothetical protein
MSARLNKTHLLALVAGLALAPLALGQNVPTTPKTPEPAPSLSPVGPAVKPAPVPGQPNVTPGKAVPIDPKAAADHGIKPSDPALSPLTWDDMAHDFGNIDDTAPVTHVFRFTNKTDKTVTILSATGSCGCTVPDLPKKTFAPDENGEMTVTFNPQHRKGPQPKAVTVQYTVPAGTPNTIVTINSNVVPLVSIEPVKMYLFEVDSKSGKSTEITVSGRKPDFQVTGVDCTNSNVKVQIGQKREVDMDGTQYQQYPLTVTVLPGAAIGQFETELSIKTNEEKQLVIPYMFVADVVGDLKANPNRLAIRAFTPHLAFNNIATLESRSGKGFKIRSVEVEGPSDMDLVVDVEATTLADNKTGYTLKLNGTTPNLNGTVNGEVIVKTDLPGDEVLRLPFSGVIRTGGVPKVVPTAH